MSKTEINSDESIPFCTMSNSKVINNKKHIIFAAILIYFWFFYIDTGSDQLSPEELESYKVRKGKLPPAGGKLIVNHFQAELSDWVRDNEEELRQIQTERRGAIQVAHSDLHQRII